MTRRARPDEFPRDAPPAQPAGNSAACTARLIELLHPLTQSERERVLTTVATYFGGRTRWSRGGQP